MARQGALFPDPATTVIFDKKRNEPRLWVRRLVIWEKPGEVIRDIPLRRGLNIIWSPDPGASKADLGLNAGSGHGAGKTLFCRLLRYCLGEETFANDELHKNITGVFPAGYVGAEVIVCGQPWAVIRPIGQTRKHITRKATTLEEVDFKEAGTGIDPILSELDLRLFPDGIDTYVSSTRSHIAWMLALAWISRDQECRFDHLLDWRHPRADSRSIASTLSKDELLIVVRAFLRLIKKEEIQAQNEREKLSDQKRSLERDKTYYERRIDQLRHELADSLSLDDNTLPTGKLALSVFRDAANGKLKALDRDGAKQSTRDKIASLRRERDTILEEIAVLTAQISRIRATEALHHEQMKALRGERANLDADEIKARLGPVCPVCNVPIERALAEGCGLSHVVHDPQNVAKEKQYVAGQIHACGQAIDRCKLQNSTHAKQLEALRRNENKVQREIDRHEREKETSERELRQKWFGLNRVLDKTTELERAYDTITRLEKSLAKCAGQDEELRDRQSAYRGRHADVLLRLNELFSYICRGLLGDNVTSTLALSGQGLQADVQVGGMAMESLKAIAFDLTALLMSIEGRADLPTFLMHDSPREADLGESIYHRLFRLISRLEEVSKEPPFQYIITTTTKPPEDLCRSSFLVAQLHGAEMKERLLRCDLS
ncbi:MAG: hypothetical protein LAO78_06630 [Acidobacteriia bacterium]|nr:hypothetical protein [Terriglobia bacterium]